MIGFLRLALIAATAFTLMAEVEPLRLDHKTRTLSHGGYSFRKTWDRPTHQWVFRVIKGNRAMWTFGDPYPGRQEWHYEDEPHYLSMGVVKAISGAGELVALREWDGANHGCTADWLIATEPEFHVLLDTTPFCFGGTQLARDIDGDGDWELEFYTTTFNFFGVGFVGSPMPSAWFKYDRKLGRYLPANHLCFAETEKQLAEDRAKLRSRPWAKKGDLDAEKQEWRQVVLDIALADLYAGHDAAGWAFFDREFPKGMRHEERRLVKKRLREDPFFQAVRRQIGATGN